MRAIARSIFQKLVRIYSSRSDYRFFLRTSLPALNSRARRLALMTDYFSGDILPIPLTPPFGKSMLVLAPHQDDEAIGCGGAMALQRSVGARAQVVVLQDGADEHESLGISREGLMVRRNRESENACSVIGLPRPHFLNHRSLLKQHDVAVKQVRDLIRKTEADAIFAPFILDNHPDHFETNRILAHSLEGIPWNVRVFGYEVWGLCIPNVIVPIDSVVEKKQRMIECFEFANAAVDYVNSTIGLNRYRARLLPPGKATHAECFFEVPKPDFQLLVSAFEQARV